MWILHNIVGLTLLFYIQGAQCQLEAQMQRMMMTTMIRQSITESIIRMQVERAVKFIVGETAVPNQQMIDFATALGRPPSSQAERDVYMDLMKKVARETPDVLLKYAKIQMLNGQEFVSVDEIALDAYVIRRALMYNSASLAREERRRKEQEKTRLREMEMQRINDMHQINLHAVTGGVAPLPAYSTGASAGTGNVDTVNMMLLNGVI